MNGVCEGEGAGFGEDGGDHDWNSRWIERFRVRAEGDCKGSVRGGFESFLGG